MRKFKVIVEKTSTGYSAYADKYPVYTTGRDVKELENNIIEAMNFSLRELGEDISVARKKGWNSASPFQASSNCTPSTSNISLRGLG